MSDRDKPEEMPLAEGVGKKKRGVVRGTLRAASFPFKRTLGAPRAHIIDNEAVLSWSEFRAMASSLRTHADKEELAELDAQQRFWADPRNWPESVRSFVLTNIQVSALVFLMLMGLSLLAVVRAGADGSLGDFARLSFLIGGVGGLFVSTVLYLGACLDYARVDESLALRARDVLGHPYRYWLFESTVDFVSFWRSLPAHIHLNWRLRSRAKTRAGAQIFIQVMQRVVIAVGLLLAPLLLLQLIALIL